MIISLLATSVTPNFSQVQKGTVTTAAGGTFHVTFSPAFTNVPQVFVTVTDGSDVLVKVSNKTVNGFDITVRSLSTTTGVFVNSVSSGAGTFVTSVPTTTASVAKALSDYDVWAASVSGGPTTTHFANTGADNGPTTVIASVSTTTAAALTSVSTTTAAALTSAGWANAGAVQIDWVALA